MIISTSSFPNFRGEEFVPVLSPPDMIHGDVMLTSSLQKQYMTSSFPNFRGEVLPQFVPVLSPPDMIHGDVMLTSSLSSVCVQ